MATILTGYHALRCAHVVNVLIAVIAMRPIDRVRHVEPSVQCDRLIQVDMGEDTQAQGRVVEWSHHWLVRVVVRVVNPSELMLVECSRHVRSFCVVFRRSTYIITDAFDCEGKEKILFFKYYSADGQVNTSGAIHIISRA